MSDIKFLSRLWVSPEREIFEMRTGIQHSQFAQEYYKDRGEEELTPPEATAEFLANGWIRVQVKPEYVAMEGTEQALVRNGDLVFDFKPDFTKLILSFYDTGKFKQIPRELVEGWSWDSIVKEAKKGTIVWGEKE